MDNVMQKIQEAFKAALNADPQLITIETTPADVPGWDSMGHVALASALESIFSLTFDVDEVMEMENVREIVRVIGGKVAS
jgi:acyl carrier protein